VAPTNRVSLRSGFSGLGGPVPFADDLMKTLGGASGPAGRARQPPTIRRNVRDILDLSQENVFRSGETTLVLGSDLSVGQRDFLSFGTDGHNGLFMETYFRGLLHGFWRSGENALFQTGGFLFSFLTRDRSGAELYLADKETSRLTQAALSLFAARTNAVYDARLAFNFGLRHEATETNFTRNIFDVDGEGLSPWRPSAAFLEFSLNPRAAWRLPKKNWGEVSFAFEGNEGLVGQTPFRSAETNASYFQRRGEAAIPLNVTFYRPNPFAFGILENALSASFQKDFGFFLFNARAAATLDGVLVGAKSLIRPNVEWEFHANLFPRGIFETELSLGRKRVPFDAELARALSPDYFSGETYYWNDANGNLAFDPGESTGRLEKKTGGAVTSADPNLREPWYYFFEMPFILRFHPKWSFRLIANYRSYRDQLWTRFSTNGSSTYEITQFPRGILPNAFLFEDPFYAGATLKLTGEGKRWFFSFSFNALMLVGATITGNGVMGNSLGTLSEATANTAALSTYAVSRLDPDRGYLARIFYAQNIADRLDFAVQLKYRDGQPFAAFNEAVTTNASGDRTAVFTPNRPHGDNPFTGDFGSREDSVWDLSIRLRYRQPLAHGELSFLLALENVFDLANELQEWTLYPFEAGRRIALETQIPRSISLSVSYTY
ncbi:MAG: hypothetical protein JNM63_05670, partial [Spirochaetia bacterium]|nr:hypothetical protein [Spirochaetia bacterium]